MNNFDAKKVKNEIVQWIKVGLMRMVRDVVQW